MEARTGFKVAKCDLRRRPRSPQEIPSIGVYRAWRNYACLPVYPPSCLAGRQGCEYPQQPTGIQMSVFVVRAFLRMRGILTGNRELARRLTQLEKELKKRLDVHETAIIGILQRIMDLIDPPPGPENEKKTDWILNGRKPRSWSAPACPPFFWRACPLFSWRTYPPDALRAQAGLPCLP